MLFPAPGINKSLRNSWKRVDDEFWDYCLGSGKSIITSFNFGSWNGTSLVITRPTLLLECFFVVSIFKWFQWRFKYWPFLFRKSRIRDCKINFIIQKYDYIYWIQQIIIKNAVYHFTLNMVTSMLVTNVGKQMCWWQVWDVGDRFKSDSKSTDSKLTDSKSST